MLYGLLRYAYAGVLHFQYGIIVLPGHAHAHGAFIGIFYGVFHKVHRHLFKAHPIAIHGDGAELCHEPYVFILGKAVKAGTYASNQLVKVQLFKVELPVRRILLYKTQKLRNYPRKPVHLMVNVPEELLHHGGIRVILIQYIFRKQFHRSKGRLQLMGGIGHEFVAHPVVILYTLTHAVEGAAKLGYLAAALFVHSHIALCSHAAYG